MAIRYVSEEKIPFKILNIAKDKLEVGGSLLWGDAVKVPPNPTKRDGLMEVKARGRKMWIKDEGLDGEPLLEFYFIDVGQGDGVLVKTPDGKHLLVDGGYIRKMQPTGKNAADFVDWKFAKDYGAGEITIDALIASHSDADHYGGLWDLINPDESYELDLTKVKIGAFYHAGVGWWKDAAGKRSLGKKQDGHLVSLLGDRESLGKALASNTLSPQGNWGSFIEQVHKQGCPVQRVSDKTGFLPGFRPQDGDVSIKVLGPVEFEVNGKPALKSLGDDSQNTNGHSVLLRFDYGNSRILLTGDLNEGSQNLLIERYKNEPEALACDVTKSCHHGSDDCSFRFLQMIGAGVTVISSGDSETHAHPRPAIVAASALTGHLELKDDKVITPLVYSTEISRSVRFGKPVALSDTKDGIKQDIKGKDKPWVHFEETAAGALRASKGVKQLPRMHVVPGVVYGLVNVRTDGEKIICATLNEGSANFNVRSFSARF